MFTKETFTSLSPAWWGAIAGAIAAGATLFPESRIIGGIGGGIAMLFVAKKISAPCCADCAGASTDTEQPKAVEPTVSLPALADFAASSPATSCASCGGLDMGAMS